MGITILTGDCREVLRELPPESVHCVVTSPPYWGLRDYGTAKWDGGDAECNHESGNYDRGERADRNHDGRTTPFRGACGKCGARRIDSQIGLEPDFNSYIATMVEVFREVRRALRRDGTLWLNLGDSYATGAGSGRSMGGDSFGKQNKVIDLGSYPGNQPNRMPQPGLKPKDLCGIPWRVAFALQADGWWLRQDIIWSKPNPMPESIADRCTKAHEYLFLLSKSERYYYDAEAIAEEGTGRSAGNNGHVAGAGNNDPFFRTREGFSKVSAKEWSTRNKRSVWEIATASFSETHFATFPPALIEPCIKAGTSEKGCCAKCGAPWVRQVEKSDDHKNDLARGHRGGNHGRNDAAAGMRDYKVETLGWSPSCSCAAVYGSGVRGCTVLDPFGGAGTTGLVADRLQRNAILIELNSEYSAMGARRIKDDAGMFAQVDEQL